MFSSGHRKLTSRPLNLPIMSTVFCFLCCLRGPGRYSYAVKVIQWPETLFLYSLIYCKGGASCPFSNTFCVDCLGRCRYFFFCMEIFCMYHSVTYFKVDLFETNKNQIKSKNAAHRTNRPPQGDVE